MKLVCAQQMFVNNSYADFLVSPRNSLVDYARSVTDGRKSSPQKEFLFYFLKNF